jgi:hypothetical protein
MERKFGPEMRGGSGLEMEEVTRRWRGGHA